jgi:hypothetical protein
MSRLVIPVALFSILAIGAVGCGGEGNPAAPSSMVSQPDAAATSDVRAEVVLTGLVRGLNWRTRTFTLVGRTDASGSTHLIRISDRTVFTTGDRPVRPRTLENGASVEVHGVAAGAEVLAAKIEILRRRGR